MQQIPGTYESPMRRRGVKSQEGYGKGGIGAECDATAHTSIEQFFYGTNTLTLHNYYILKVCNVFLQKYSGFTSQIFTWALLGTLIYPIGFLCWR